MIFRNGVTTLVAGTVIAEVFQLVAYNSSYVADGTIVGEFFAADPQIGGLPTLRFRHSDTHASALVWTTGDGEPGPHSIELTTDVGVSPKARLLLALNEAGTATSTATLSGGAGSTESVSVGGSAAAGRVLIGAMGTNTLQVGPTAIALNPGAGGITMNTRPTRQITAVGNVIPSANLAPVPVAGAVVPGMSWVLNVNASDVVDLAVTLHLQCIAGGAVFTCHIRVDGAPNWIMAAAGIGGEQTSLSTAVILGPFAAGNHTIDVFCFSNVAGTYNVIHAFTTIAAYRVLSLR